jgi:hypothetical protein
MRQVPRRLLVGDTPDALHPLSELLHPIVSKAAAAAARVAGLPQVAAHIAAGQPANGCRY